MVEHRTRGNRSVAVQGEIHVPPDEFSVPTGALLCLTIVCSPTVRDQLEGVQLHLHLWPCLRSHSYRDNVSGTGYLRLRGAGASP